MTTFGGGYGLVGTYVIKMHNNFQTFKILKYTLLTRSTRILFDNYMYLNPAKFKKTLRGKILEMVSTIKENYY